MECISEAQLKPYKWGLSFVFNVHMVEVRSFQWSNVSIGSFNISYLYDCIARKSRDMQRIQLFRDLTLNNG